MSKDMPIIFRVEHGGVRTVGNQGNFLPAPRLDVGKKAGGVDHQLVCPVVKEFLQQLGGPDQNRIGKHAGGLWDPGRRSESSGVAGLAGE